MNRSNLDKYVNLWGKYKVNCEMMIIENDLQIECLEYELHYLRRRNNEATNELKAIGMEIEMISPHTKLVRTYGRTYMKAIVNHAFVLTPLAVVKIATVLRIVQSLFHIIYFGRFHSKLL